MTHLKTFSSTWRYESTEWENKVGKVKRRSGTVYKIIKVTYKRLQRKTRKKLCFVFDQQV